MSKPSKIPLSYNNSAADRLEAVDNALWHIGEAMEALLGLGEYSDTYDTLEELHDALEPEYAQLEIDSAGEYTEYIVELVRDYYRSAL